ncbi:MAG: ribonuclease HII [Microthrixaceae bacterium]
MGRRRPPGSAIERSYRGRGVRWIVGVDEVGRGAWAGPLTIGVAAIPLDRRVNGIRDSKLLREATRERLFDRIVGWCEAWSIGHASPAECDALGMSEAQRLATRRAFDALPFVPEVALTDGRWDFVAGGPTGATATHLLVGGDATCLSIATASILAKVTRDRIMRRYADEFPAHSFDTNKGYPCPRHRMALDGYGPTSIHRRSWVFMDSLIWPGLRRPAVGSATSAGRQGC